MKKVKSNESIIVNVNQDSKNKKKFSFKKMFFSLLIFFNIVNIFILVVFDNKSSGQQKIVDVKELGVVITKNGSYDLRIDNLPRKVSSYLSWESSNPKIIDVSSCNHSLYCTLTPIGVGDVTIKVNYIDKKNNVSDSDTIYVSIIESEVINFYFNDGSIYADKLSQKVYADLDDYEKRFSYTCKSIDCQFITGDYHAIIKDDKYLYVDINDKNLDTDCLNHSAGCSNSISCVDNVEDEFEFSDIVALIDDSSKISSLIIGSEGKYTGVYSFTSHGLKKIDFSHYQKISTNDYDLLLYNSNKTHLFNSKTSDIKTINFKGINMGSYYNSMTYYFLSTDSTDYNKNCVILDSNYNFLFNSKVFEYAFIENNKLFTYETIDNRKVARVYNLDGNEESDYFDNDFEFFDYFYSYGFVYSPFAFGKQNGKLVFIRLFDKKVLYELNEDVNQYSYGRVFNNEEASNFLSNHNLEPLLPNQLILKIYDSKNHNFMVIRYSFDSEVRAQILLKGSE